VSRALLPAPIPEGLSALHPDVPATVFSQDFRDACLTLDRYVGAVALELAHTLHLASAEVPSATALLDERGWCQAGEPALRWLLDTLVLYGHAERTGEGWRVAAPAPATPSATLEAEAVRALPAAAPAYAVMRIAAAALPDVLAGSCRGEDALFNAGTLPLWFAYFNNDNPHYYPNNAMAALAVARAVPAGARILEVGGGAGSAAVAIATALHESGKPPASYLFTELQPAFLRRGARAAQAALGTGCTVVAKTFDINEEPATLGVEPASLDAIVGVNTLHLAVDLVATLTRLATLLRPGGVLVLGEVLRPAHTGTVHLELPFALLDSYARVKLEMELRPRPGFLTVAQWRRALAAAGYRQVSVLPAAIQRCAELYPGFYAGALVAHR